MADKNISTLTDAAAITGTERFHVIQGGVSRYVTAAQLATFALGNVGKLVQARATATAVTSNVNKLLEWNSVLKDDDTFHDPGQNTRIVAPWAGDYRIALYTAATDSDSHELFTVYTNVNRAGSTTTFNDMPELHFIRRKTPAGANTNLGIQVYALKTFAASDYFEIVVNHNISQTLYTYTQVNMEYLG